MQSSPALALSPSLSDVAMTAPPGSWPKWEAHRGAGPVATPAVGTGQLCVLPAHR